MQVRKLISIIVPIYNAQMHLQECLLSICDQSYSNLEILLINDGSTDDSSKICTAFSKDDHRIKVLHTTNSGVAAARNVGLSIAKGDYIAFIDSDDMVNANYIYELYKTADAQDADIVCCGYTYTNNKLRYEHNDFRFLSNTRESFVEHLLQNTGGTICSKLFKASIITANQLRFHNSLKMREDLIFSLEFAFFADCFLVAHNYNYNYNDRNTQSLSKSDNIENRLFVRNIIKRTLEKHSFNRGVQERLLNIWNKEILFIGIKACMNFKKPIKKIQAFYGDIEIRELSTQTKIEGIKETVLFLPAKLRSPLLTYITYRTIYGNKL